MNETAADQKTSAFDSLVVTRLLERLLGGSRQLLNQARFEATSDFLTRYGHWALLVAGALGLVVSLILSVKQSAFFVFVEGMGWLLLLLVLQYTAARFLKAGDALLQSTPSQLSTPAFLNCYALVNLLTGCIALVSFAIMAIKLESMRLFLEGMGVFLICEYLAWIALNPALLNIESTPRASAGEEAVGILSFFLKGFLKLLPIAFGAGLIIGTVGLLIDAIGLPKAGVYYSLLDAAPSLRTVTVAAALPFAGYVLFLLAYLGLDVIRAIVAVPGKLDDIAAGKRQPPV